MTEEGPKVSVLFHERYADVAQRAADILACAPPKLATEGIVVIHCSLERFEALLDEGTS